MNVAIIPARGGSKRIPGKNIKPFLGKPVMAYVIEAARDSGLFEHILVSTDSEAIAEVAQAHGAEVPFLRPPELADDYTGTGPVVKHALSWVCDHLGTPDYACCLYPASPLIQADFLQQAHEQLCARPEKQFVFSVGRYRYPVQCALTWADNGGVRMLYPEHAGTRSQDLPETFHDAGMFYWGRTQAFLTDQATFAPHSLAYPLPDYGVVDIDTEEDWQWAELLFEVLRRRGLR